MIDIHQHMLKKETFFLEQKLKETKCFLLFASWKAKSRMTAFIAALS